MKEFSRGVRSLVVASFLVAVATSPTQADDAVVYWDSNSGFSTTFVTINAGDYVYLVNNDDPDFGFPVTIIGNPPESFNIYNLPPGYYSWHQYNNPGTFSFYDNWFIDTVIVQVNSVQPLAVAITDPTNNAAFTAPATFIVTALPSGGAGSYDVEFFVGTNSIGDVFTSPFTNTATALLAGTYAISAVVTDLNFDRATNTISVTVNPLVLAAPRVVANQFLFDVSGLTVGKTNIVQTSGGSATWSGLKTNLAGSISTTITNSLLSGPRLFRVIQLP